MLKTIAALLIFIVWTPWCRAGEIVTLGFFDAKPHIMYDKSAQKVHGALVTFLSMYMAPEMGITFRWTEHPFNVARQLKMIEEGRLDGAALLVWSEDRAKRVSYTRKPFAWIRSVISVKQENPLVRVTSPGDLSAMRIGSASGTFITEFMRDPAIKLIPVFTPEPNSQNLKKLMSGRLDAVYIQDKSAMLSELRDAALEGLVRVIELPVPPSPVHVVFGKAHQRLVRRYDKAFDRIKGTQVYRLLLARYMDVDGL